MDPEYDVLKGIEEEIIVPIKELTTTNLDASNHEIDEHYQQQDNLQQLQKEAPLLDAEAEVDYEDRYATQGQEDDEERTRQENEEEHTRSLWQHTST